MKHENAVNFAVSTNNKIGTTPASWIGIWTNQMGSSMNLSVNGTDLTGDYTSSNSAKNKTDAISGKIKGYVSGDLIAFVVFWPGGSMTSWTGQLINDEAFPKIKTLWHLVTDVEDQDEPTRLWTSTLAGADEFTR